MKKTAITLSIERKQQKIEFIASEIKNLEFNHPVPYSKIQQYKTRIDELEAQVEEDKELLATEREQIEGAYDQHRCAGNFDNGKDYYQNTYVIVDSTG